jgi:HEAT repeat protein
MRRLGALLLVLAAVCAGCSREPSARGKKLGDWINILKRSNDVAQLKETAAALTELGPNAEPAAWELVRLLSDRQAFAHYRSLTEQQVEEVYQVFTPALRAIGPATGPLVLQAIEYNRPVSADVMRALHPTALPALLKGLEHKEARVRRTVAGRWRDLGSAGRSGTDALILALRDADGVVRSEAAMSLGAIDPEPGQAVRVLLDALKDQVPLVRTAAAESLGHFPTEAERLLEPLVNRLLDPDPAVREAAAGSISRYGPQKERAVPPLLKIITGADAGARRAAMRAVIGLEGLKLLPVDTLVSFITDTNFAVQAVQTLLSLNPRAALFVPELVGHLRERGDTATAQRQNAFARIGADAVPTLTTMLKYQEPPAAEAEVVRYEAAMALAAIGADAKSALPVLNDLAESETSEHVRVAAIEAIRRIKARLKWVPR